MRTKTALRANLRDQLRNLSFAARQRADQQIRKLLLTLLAGYTPGPLCAYAATVAEVDLQAVLQQLDQRGWQIGLPIISAQQPGLMTMHVWQPGAALFANRYGIDEPAVHSALMPPDDIDVCLLPLLAFTARGDRLGMGAGYYDRWLAKCPPRMLRIGIAYQCQQVAELPVDEWDQPMHLVVTETGVKDCRQYYV